MPFISGQIQMISSKDYCIVLYCIVLYCIICYCIALHCIVLYCIILCCVFKMWVIFLFIQNFSKKLLKESYFFAFINDEKSIPHFTISPLDYGWSGVYLENCKATETLTLLVASCFYIKIGISKDVWMLSWPLTFVT